MYRLLMLVFCIALLAGPITGCDSDGPAEDAGESVDEALDDAGDAGEELGDDAEDTFE